MSERIEFDLESKLVNVLHQTSEASRLFTRRNAELLVFREVELGGTIPDLVIVRRRSSHHDGRRPVRLTVFESWIIGELMRSGALRSTTITRKLFAFAKDTDRALKRLERRRFVTKTEDGAYALVEDFSARFEILAIEAKLTRWKAAIEQAKDYFRFSNLVYIALPESVIDRNGAIEEACEREGIGLIAVATDGIDLVVSPAPAAKPDQREWAWMLAKTGAFQI